MDFKKLLTRTLSGLVYCLIIVGCIYGGKSGVIILTCLLSILACIEFAKMSHDLSRQTFPLLLVDILGCVMLCTAFNGTGLILWIATIIVRIVEQLYVKSDHPMRDLAHSFMSQIYIGLPMALIGITAYWFSPMLILALFFFLWINDTGAFLCGVSFGRHKLFERLSPKKTWEGFIGGLVFTIGSAALFGTFGNEYFGMDYVCRTYNILAWLGFGAVVSIFGTWGDLAESLMKRNLNVKDSGTLIPGHGGILDRIDSLLLAAPATFIYFVLLSL